MDETHHRQAFTDFCESINCEPTDERFVFWIAALRHTRTQQPVAYAVLDSAGLPAAILDAIPPGMRPAPVPLYASPVAKIDKPPLTRQQIQVLWDKYCAPDIESLVRAVERYMSGV